jgi:hypothetical protein
VARIRSLIRTSALVLTATCVLLSTTLVDTAWASTPVVPARTAPQTYQTGADCTGVEDPQACNVANSVTDFWSQITQHDGGPLSFFDGFQIADCVTYEAGRVAHNPATGYLKSSCASALAPHIKDQCGWMSAGKPPPAEGNCEQAFKKALDL